MPWAVSGTTFLVFEIVSVGLAAVLTMLGGHHLGLRWGMVIAVAFAILVPCRTVIVETHEQKRQRKSLSVESMTQDEYDALEEPDDRTLHVIVPKQPKP